MAYRFVSASNDFVDFALAPFSGTTFGAMTFAVFVKRATIGNHPTISFTDSAGTNQKDEFALRSGGDLRLTVATNVSGTAGSFSSTSIWYLFVVTWAGGTATPRFHIHDGTSWTHVNGTSALAGDTTLGGTDRLRFGRGLTGSINADVVCCGVKKTSSADLTVETLSRTAFSAWQSFGFDWLIGFDTSLQSAGVLQDQASPGTGDEISKSGTSVVADPAGWSWVAAATSVPQTIVIS